MQTFEELLQAEMETPITVTDKKTQQTHEMMPLRAMVIAVKNNAMKGDIGAIQFVRNLMGTQREETEEQAAERTRLRQQAEHDITEEFKAEGLTLAPTDAEMLASQLLTIRRLAALMEHPDHQDTEERPQRDGTRQVQLSQLNRIYADTVKQYRADRQQLKADARSAAIMRKQLR